MSSQAKRTQRLLARGGILRPHDLDAHGIQRKHLHELSRRGLAQHVGRGLYRNPLSEVSAHQSLIEAALKAPRGVICLLSALRFHELTDQAPFEVWIALANKDWHPASQGVPLRVMRFSPASLAFGVESHKLDGVPVRIFSAPKTVADCFKFRNKIGVDVAIAALRDCLRKRRATIAQLRAAAEVDRVARVMQPYLEALA